MRPEFGPSELQRALARPDCDELRHELAESYKWLLWHQAGEDQTVSERDRGGYLDSLFVDRDGRLAMCALAMADYDDPRFLGFLAASVLEDALDTHPWEEPVSDDFLGRVVDEARRTPRFRWMLSGVWTCSAEPHVAEAVKQAVGSVSSDNDPLPPRPLT